MPSEGMASRAAKQAMAGPPGAAEMTDSRPAAGMYKRPKQGCLGMDHDSANGSMHAASSSRMRALLAVRQPWEEWTLVAAATLMAVAIWNLLTAEVRYFDNFIGMTSTIAVAAATMVFTRLWIRGKPPRAATQAGTTPR